MASSVLVVEDDDLLRPLTVEGISLLELEVLECASADEALSMLEAQSSIALIVTDICMPGSMDGFEMAKIVWSRWPQLPIILTSGNRVVSECLLPSHSMFIRKPWTLDALHQAVKRYLPD